MPFYTGEKNFFFTLFLGCAARGTPRTCLMLPICATTSCPGRNLLCFVMRTFKKFLSAFRSRQHTPSLLRERGNMILFMFNVSALKKDTKIYPKR